MNDLTLYVNTHSSCADCWPMFWNQLNKHWPTHPPAVVACGCGKLDVHGVPSDWWYAPNEWIKYSAATKFSNQYLMGLCAVETPYVLTMQEDFVLYDDVDEDAIRESIKAMQHFVYACVKLIDSGNELAYSMQASIWNTRALKSLYANVDASTPWEAERFCGWTAEDMKLKTLKRRDDQLPMRGRNHRDSPIFPYVSTALVKGRWNSEYRHELESLHKQYGIDANVRGWSV